jgi:hypothetical protein
MKLRTREETELKELEATKTTAMLDDLNYLEVD